MARRRSRQAPGSPVGWLVLAGGVLLYLGLQSAVGSSATAGVIVVALVIVVGGAGLWLRSRARHDWLRHVATLQDLLALSPTQFELAIGELLTTWGYRDVRHTGGAGDLAADLTCRTADGRSAVVQCKRYAPAHAVGSPEIQQFIGMQVVHHRAEQGIYVTTSSFTQPAQALARQHGLRTIDGAELATHIEQARKQLQPVASR
jgi:hypothetical protein